MILKYNQMVKILFRNKSMTSRFTLAIDVFIPQVIPVQRRLLKKNCRISRTPTRHFPLRGVSFQNVIYRRDWIGCQKNIFEVFSHYVLCLSLSLWILNLCFVAMFLLPYFAKILSPLVLSFSGNFTLIFCFC